MLNIVGEGGYIMVMDQDFLQVNLKSSFKEVFKSGAEGNLDDNISTSLAIAAFIEKIVVLYKDRLVRFGFELIESICTKFGTVIEIVDITEKTEEQELVEDLIQIVTVFSCRLQGKRANKAKKMLKELMENDTSQEG